MSTVDTSTWSSDSDLNVEIEGIPLNSNASIAQTWQAIQVLMAALKGDTSAIKLTINQPDGTTIVATNQTLTVVDNGHTHTISNVDGLQTALNGKAANADMQGATASADGASGLVPKPEAGDQDKVLKGDGTWGTVEAGDVSVAWEDITDKPSTFPPSSHAHGNLTNDGKLSTASRAVVTDANGKLAGSSVTATELGYLSGVTSAVQTQLDVKATDSTVVHLAESETVTGLKTFNNDIVLAQNKALRHSEENGYVRVLGGASEATGARIVLSGAMRPTFGGEFECVARSSSAQKKLVGRPDGTLTWDGQAIQTSSDERFKTRISVVPDEILDAWESVEWGQFQFLAAVSAKGNAARLHLGLIAQRVKTAFEKKGLNACAYGILCHEVRPATKEERAVDIWMVRYEEALAMEAACQRRRADRLEARVATLEERLNG